MEFKWIYGHGEGFEDAAAVRKTVFCDEQGYSIELELDDTDRVAWHVVGYEDDAPICTARMYGQPQTGLHVGRVAVLKESRGLGLGRAVMEQQEQKAKELGAQKLVLNAQMARKGFYEALGYAPTGETSLDEGVPHMEMHKALA